MKKVSIICDPKKYGCGMSYEVNVENVKDQKYIMCPHCGRIAPNPFYSEKEE